MDYLAHPANVAIVLARYGCEQVTVVAGILHHVLEEAAPGNRPLLERKIADKFGPVALASQTVDSTENCSPDRPCASSAAVA